MIDRSYYSLPVSQLLDHGSLQGEVEDVDSWFDYVGHYGFGEVEAITLVDLMYENFENKLEQPNERLASIHACRALAQIGDMFAEDDFLYVVKHSKNDELVRNATAALPLLARAHLANLEGYFYDDKMKDTNRIGIAEQAYELTERYAQVRERCITFLMAALSKYERYSRDLNGFLIYFLVKLEATAASTLIQTALASGKASDEMTGSWPAVQVALKLADETDFAPEDLLCAGDRQRQKEQNLAILLPQKQS